MDHLSGEKFQVHHFGYETTSANEDPDRVVPGDVLRDMEREGVISELHNVFYTCAGVGTPVSNSRKIGKGIAEKLKASGVDGAILTST